jgi:hypothetical protein
MSLSGFERLRAGWVPPAPPRGAPLHPRECVSCGAPLSSRVCSYCLRDYGEIPQPKPDQRLNPDPEDWEDQ